MNHTIPELKKTRSFTIEEVRRDALIKDEEIISTYTFKYEAKDKEKALYISGDVFGDEKMRVTNALEVLFYIAKGWPIKVNIEKKLDIVIRDYNVKLDLYK